MVALGHARIKMAGTRQIVSPGKHHACLLRELYNEVSQLLTDLVDGVKLLLAEFDRCTNHVLIKMLHPGSSRDRQHRARAFEEPGERNLTGLGIVPLSDLVEGSPGVSQFSKCQRGPGDETNTLTGTQIDHLLGLVDRHMFGLALR